MTNLETRDPRDGRKTIDQWRIPQTIAITLLVSWWLGLGFYYYHQPKLSFRWDLALKVIPNPLLIRPTAAWTLVQHLIQLAALTVLGAGIGHLCLSKLRVPVEDNLEWLAVGVGIGWGALGLGMALLGLLGRWYPAPILVCVAVATTAAGLSLYRSGLCCWQQEQESWPLGDKIMLGALVVFIATNLFWTSTPEIFHDALAYHLALPDLYWRWHGIRATPYNVYSGAPMLVQMLFGLALPVGGPTLAHLIHWAFGVLSVVLLYSLGRRFLSRRAGLLAGLLYYSTPLVGVMSSKSGVDIGVAFFQFLAVYTLARGFAVETGRERWWLVSGISTGLAMGAKYQAWPLAIVLGAILLWKQRALPENAAWQVRRGLPVFFTAAAAVLAIWPLLNLCRFGNPVYPFFQEIFVPGTAGVDWRGMIKDGGRDLTSTFQTWAGFMQLLLSPWFMSTQQLDTHSFGPVFLLGLPLLALVRFKGGVDALVFPAMISLWILGAATTVVPRWFLPSFLLSAWLFASAFERAFPDYLKKIAYALVSYVLCANYFWTLSWFATYGVEQVVLGKETPEEYLSKPHPSYGFPYFPCARYANIHLQPDARLLIVAEPRGYFIERDYVASSVFNENPLAHYLRESHDYETLQKRLAENGFTHIMVNVASLNGHGFDHWLRLNPREKALYMEFASRGTRLVFEERHRRPDGDNPWCAIYEIAPFSNRRAH